jgi:hypothetical protein
MRAPRLPTRPAPLDPRPATPTGEDSFEPVFGETPPPPITAPPDSTSGNSKYALIIVMDDEAYNAPTDDEGQTIGVGYQT